jgi:hypothetical protein
MSANTFSDNGSGTCNFGSSHITTTGNVTANKVTGNLIQPSGGTVTSADGTINCDNDHITTTGNATANYVTATGVFKVPTYNDSTRPSASTVGAGAMIYNTDDSAPNFSDGTNWTDAVGVTT